MSKSIRKYFFSIGTITYDLESISIIKEAIWVLVLVCVCYGVFNGTNHSTHVNSGWAHAHTFIKEKNNGILWACFTSGSVRAFLWQIRTYHKLQQHIWLIKVSSLTEKQQQRRNPTESKWWKVF